MIMSFKTFLPRILKNNRESMRDCALNYRAAVRRGDLAYMVTWLILASHFRRLNLNLLECA